MPSSGIGVVSTIQGLEQLGGAQTQPRPERGGIEKSNIDKTSLS